MVNFHQKRDKCSQLFLRFCLVFLFLVSCNGQVYGADQIYGAVCTGVNIYNKEVMLSESIFNVCPSSVEIQRFMAGGFGSASGAFTTTVLSRQLLDQTVDVEISLGMKEFASQIWSQSPIPAAFTPFATVASNFHTASFDKDTVRNTLYFSNSDRMRAYQSRITDQVFYVIGRVMTTEHFSVEWTDPPADYHLGSFFKQRVRQLDMSDASMDSFIRDFGTHFRIKSTFGGKLGTDYYFQGYGTTRDRANALNHVDKADLLAAQNTSYVVPFSGFGDDVVRSYSWSLPPGAATTGVFAWMNDVQDNPQLISEELRSLSELFQLVDIPSSYAFVDKFLDRIVSNAWQMLNDNYNCLYSPCDATSVCMGSSCVPRPVAPRWPDYSRFCIPKPNDERCPSSDQYDEFHDNTWVYWDTENGEPDTPYIGADHITSHGLAPGKINAVIDNANGGGIKMFYCCSKQPTTNSWDRVQWPSGTYCIYNYVTQSVLLPDAWCFDSILWNDEDTNNQNHFRTYPDFGAIPMGHYHPSYTEQKLMCRDDGDPSDPIVLPKEYPFYLVRNGDTCQEVWGMFWTHVEVSWDTENDIIQDNEVELNEEVRTNMWKRICRKCGPDCLEECESKKDKKSCVQLTQDKIVMDFCYYQEIMTPGPTPGPTPSPTPPTQAPTTGAPTPAPPTPTPPPTPPPPTRRPTPMPTRPTPSPNFPTLPPTRSPTLSPPTPRPTRKPTPAPTPPTPAPTQNPTTSPTPSPTTCPYCDQLQGVNIVGLHSKWQGDEQPTMDIFSVIPCACDFCQGDECLVREDCRIKYHMGDFMLLQKFWLDRPIELERDDLLFLRVTWPVGAVDDGPRNDFFATAAEDYVRRNAVMDLAHARNALLYGGSIRMQHYAKAHSILQRHIGSNYFDTVLSATHWVTRTRVKHVSFVYREAEPTLQEFSFPFATRGAQLWRALHDLNAGTVSTEYCHNLFDTFINDFGTHYVWSVAVGGSYGGDWYFSGYGTKAEMSINMRDIKNADLADIFERNRFREMNDEPLNGKSFIRNIGGSQLVPHDIIGWNVGGDPYGIRGGRGDDEWARHLDMGQNVEVLHYKKLISIGNLLTLFENPAYVTNYDQFRAAVRVKFKDRVVEIAHYWLVLHYRCFFMDTACENRRRHPFLREAFGESCSSDQVSREWMRQRTEMEICIGQETTDSGYMLKSKHFPFLPSKWCKGRIVNGHPTNHPPYTPTRKSNCPLVPPIPRWPNAHSYCLPKPIPTEASPIKECPKEQYPEYEWNWDWQDFIQDHHENHDLFSAVISNEYFAGPHNINPTNEIFSMYPWRYRLDDYMPRDTIYEAAAQIAAGIPLQIPDEDGVMQDNPDYLDPAMYYDTAVAYVDYLANYDPTVMPQRNGPCHLGLCNYVLGYVEYPQYPVNRVYVRTQAPFLQEIGWMFWDTEDTTDNREFSEIQVAFDPTPTHMAVADSFKLTSYWEDDCQGITSGCIIDTFTPEDMAVGGKVNTHELNPEKYRLWMPPAEASFGTGGTRMQFCCTTISEGQEEKATHNLHWPNGHLCIYAHGAVDSTIYEFKQGSIGWDCENGNIQAPKIYGNKIYSDSANDLFQEWDEVAAQQRLTHSLPTGLYHIQYDGRSDQFFSQNVLCMDENTDPTHHIELPRDRSFYLMQFKGTCQAVVGMKHTRVELTIFTEIDHKTTWTETGTYDRMFIPLEMNSWGRAQAYGRRDQIPDGHYGQDKMMIKYCFYQPNIVYKRLPAGTLGPVHLPWFFLDPLSVGDKWDDTPELIHNVLETDPEVIVENNYVDIFAMDDNGGYTVRWPEDHDVYCPRV